MRKLLVPLAGLVVAGSLLAIWLAGHELPPRLDRQLHEAAGRALAAEVAKLAAAGGHINVIRHDTVAFAQPADDALFAGLERGLHDAGRVIADTQLIALDPLRAMQVPPGDFFEQIRRAAPGDVVVSLMGPPFLTEEQRITLGTVKPRIVAFWPGSATEYASLGSLFEQGLLQAAIISRTADGKAPAASPGEGSFESRYRVVMPAAPR